MDKAEEQTGVEVLRERVAKAIAFAAPDPVAGEFTWGQVDGVLNSIGIPLETLAALAGGEMVAARRELINRPRQHYSGLRAAVTWLHNRAKEMNDPHAEAILNAAAFQLGNDMRHLTAAPPSPRRSPVTSAETTPPPRGRFQDQVASGEGQEGPAGGR